MNYVTVMTTFITKEPMEPVVKQQLQATLDELMSKTVIPFVTGQNKENELKVQIILDAAPGDFVRIPRRT